MTKITIDKLLKLVDFFISVPPFALLLPGMQTNEEEITRFIKNALAEDVGDGDHTSLSTIPPDMQGTARLLVKEDCTLAGIDLAIKIFRFLEKDIKLEIFKYDGDRVKTGDEAFFVTGNVHTILKAERLILNCMQRMSAIATQTREVVDLLKGTKTKVLDTRKTTPGFRFLEKWAVRIGGGVNHRIGLYDMILIKDNHVDYAGGIKQAIASAKNHLQKQHKQLDIEIEVRNLDELQQAVEAGGVQRIMLDNFDFDTLKKAVDFIGGKFVTEASGGITLQNVRQYAECGVDYISMGTLTHSVKSIDLSLKAVRV